MLERVDVEETSVYENHLKDSPSATSRTVATLSTFATRHEPRSTERVRNALRLFGDATMDLCPRESFIDQRFELYSARFFQPFE